MIHMIRKKWLVDTYDTHDRYAEKYNICMEKTRDNKTTRSGTNPEKSICRKVYYLHRKNEGQQKGPMEYDNRARSGRHRFVEAKRSKMIKT